MLWAESPLEPVARPFVELRRGIVSLLLIIEICEAIHARQCVRMFFPQRLLFPFQHSSVHRLGLLILSLVLQQQCQVADARQRGRVLYPQRFPHSHVVITEFDALSSTTKVANIRVKESINIPMTRSTDVCVN
jgi:hypothetical protein